MHAMSSLPKTPYLCGFCGFSFASPWACEHHKRLDHDGYAEECDEILRRHSMLERYMHGLAAWRAGVT
jgi:hypothetical protein